MTARFSLLMWVACLFLSACGGETIPPVNAPESPFYDVQGFFEKEVERLQTERVAVMKKVSFDGTTEEHRMDSLDFHQELKVFLDADINRTAWWDRYAIDSNMQNGSLSGITYEALDPDLKIRSLRLGFAESGLRVVDINLASKSPATEFSQELHYDTDSGYSIRTAQDVVLSRAGEMLVEARFLE